MAKTIDLHNHAIVIYHCDNDGYLSGTLLRLYANSQGVHDDNIRYFRYNYGNINELETFIDDMQAQGVLDENTYVLMGDISISSVTATTFKRLFGMVKDSTHKWWFDHHRSSIDVNNNDEELSAVNGVRSAEYCGAMLIYKMLHDEIVEGLESRNIFGGIDDYVVYLVDDHDRFVHEMPESRAFLAGSMLYEESMDPSEYFWIDMLAMCHNYDYSYELETIVEKGNTVIQYKKNDEKLSLKSLGFERDFVLKSKDKQVKSLKMYCINRAYNSDIFGELYEQYPIVCCFTYNGKNWKYSLYSSRKDACCDKIAQAYSPAGGGHPGAAGFTRAENIFNKLCVTTPPIKCNLEDYFKDYAVTE